MAVMALCSITIGTLYQKRFVQPCDVRTANTVQLLAATVVTLPLALAESSRRTLEALGYAVDWHVYPMPHSVSMDEIADIAAWLKARIG